jgi:hypothetical protein
MLVYYVCVLMANRGQEYTHSNFKEAHKYVLDLVSQRGKPKKELHCVNNLGILDPKSHVTMPSLIKLGALFAREGVPITLTAVSALCKNIMKLFDIKEGKVLLQQGQHIHWRTNCNSDGVVWAQRPVVAAMLVDDYGYTDLKDAGGNILTTNAELMAAAAQGRIWNAEKGRGWFSTKAEKAAKAAEKALRTVLLPVQEHLLIKSDPNKTGLKGVHQDKGRYKATCNTAPCHGHHLGMSGTAEEAAQAYLQHWEEKHSEELEK